jgi:hypothetical protein
MSASLPRAEDRAFDLIVNWARERGIIQPKKGNEEGAENAERR